LVLVDPHVIVASGGKTQRSGTGPGGTYCNFMERILLRKPGFLSGIGGTKPGSVISYYSDTF
jgi:hypothetical protein